MHASRHDLCAVYIIFWGFLEAWCDFCTVTFSTRLHRDRSRGVKHPRLGACGRCVKEIFWSDCCGISQGTRINCFLPSHQERRNTQSHCRAHIWTQRWVETGALWVTKERICGGNTSVLASELLLCIYLSYFASGPSGCWTNCSKRRLFRKTF